MGQSSPQRWSCAPLLFVCVGIVALLIRISSEASAQGLTCRTDSFGTTRCDNGQTFRTDSFGTTRDNYGNSWRTDSFGTTRVSDGSTYRTDSSGTTRDNYGNSCEQILLVRQEAETAPPAAQIPLGRPAATSV